LKILACAHDAGGANLLIHKFRSQTNVDFVLTGPAASIAFSLGIPFTNCLPPSGLKHYDCVYAGSNSQTQLSDEIFSQAIVLGMKTVGILDHWVNYSKRWKFKPHRVEVQDFRAFIGSSFYFGWRTRFKRNYYLKSVRSKSLNKKPKTHDLLVILQPIDGIFRHDEKELCSCFCPSILKLLGVHAKFSSIILREHSNTKSEVCREYLRLHTKLNVLSTTLTSSLSADIQRCSMVLGLDSYAMFICRRLGKKVMTISPSRRSWFAPNYTSLQ